MNREEIAQRIPSLAASLLAEKGYVAPIDLLLRLDWLKPNDLEAWRRGRIPYLERAVSGNLSRLSYAMSQLRRYAQAEQLRSSSTAYVSWGEPVNRSALAGVAIRTSSGGKPLRSDNLNRRTIKSLLEKAGLPRLDLYSLRHQHVRGLRAFCSLLPSCFRVVSRGQLGVTRYPFEQAVSSKARAFCHEFFAWYNREHRHSRIGLMTPEAVHYGQAGIALHGSLFARSGQHSAGVRFP